MNPGPAALPHPSPFRGRFLLDPADREPYAGASGILAALPAGVAIPADRDDVAALVRWAAAREVPLVPRSAGTGMPGGNVGPGIAVDLMTNFMHLGSPEPVPAAPASDGVDPAGPDRPRHRVRVEAGVTLGRLNAACAPHGLYFPVDPSSGERCTLGGMLANDSAGPHTVRFGSTRRWVHALDVVLADGTFARFERGVRAPGPPLPDRDAILDAWPRLRKNSSGYALREYLLSGDLVDLLIGSEGTLALILSAELELAPLPAPTALVVLEFSDLEAAGAAVQRILDEAPATCEMLDRTFLELVRRAGRDDGYPLRPGLEAILLVEIEPDRAARIARLAPGTTALSAREQASIWTLRRAASPIIAEQAGHRVSMQFIEDSVVPVEHLVDYVRGLRAILRRHELPAVIFGHAGDANLHVNPLIDLSAGDWLHTVEAVLEEVAALVAGLGGTLAGEHGDGRLRAPLLQTIWGEEMVARFRAVKHWFDPRGILNPGVILPLPGQKPFDFVKHQSLA